MNDKTNNTIFISQYISDFVIVTHIRRFIWVKFCVDNNSFEYRYTRFYNISIYYLFLTEE